MSQTWDYIAKLVCIGDSGTGKSSLSVRLCEGRFVNWHDVTIGVEYSSTVVPVGPPASLALGLADAEGPKTSLPPPPVPASEQKRMKLSLWDTAGQETYKSITRSYFRGASGALLVFDITRRATFDSVTGWLHDLRQIAEEGIVVILVGNKSDLTGASIVGGGGEESASTGAGSTSPTTASGTTTTTSSSKNKREVTRPEAEAWCKANNVLQYVETSAKSGEGVERAFLHVAERIFQNIEAGKYDLNDRRSGVKGPGAGGAGAGGGRNKRGEVVLGVNDVGGMRAGSKGGWGACC